MKNVDEAIAYSDEKLSAKLEEKKDIPEMKQIPALMKPVDFTLEVMQETTEDAVVSKHVDNNGEGIHCISVAL